MCPGELPGTIDQEGRAQRPDADGFLCAGHTTHSTEAMRVRKVTDRCVVRIFTRETLFLLRAATRGLPDASGDWNIFCLGLVCRTSEDVAKGLYANSLTQQSKTSSCFTAHVYAREKVLCVSLTSGVLMKRFETPPLNMTGDSCTAHRCTPWPSMPKTRVCPRDSPKSWYEYFSTFFLMVPFGRMDRPPRTIMASMQSIQGISLPWTPGTSAYRPHYSCIPLVRTDTLESILMKTHGTTKIWQLYDRNPSSSNDLPVSNEGDNGETTFLPEESIIPPGMLLLTAVVNDTRVYEDAALVCKAAVDRGLFHCTLMSVFSLKEKEDVPCVGGRVTVDKYAWWKVCTKESKRCAKGASRMDSYGIVKKIGPVIGGRKSVHVESTSTLQDGDKIATWHGQKYTCRIVPREDLPWIEGEHGTIYPDLVISETSLVKRLTNGAVMDMEAAMGVIKRGESHTVVTAESFSSSLDSRGTLMSGQRGVPIQRIENGVSVDVEASYGLMWVVEQIQKSRDKSHYTHNLVSQGATKPDKGRSAGGAIRQDEMSVYAAAESGLLWCADELRARSAVVVVDVCDACHLLIPSCTCRTPNPACTPFALPLETVVTTLASTLYHSSSVEFYA